jgi:glycerol-3-phosphate dehydrogenase (NAD(P)+)
MKDISVIGCGRWGTFLAWYAANRCPEKIKNVLMYDLKTSPNFIELRDTRKNEYLSLSDNMFLYENLADVLVNDTIIVSIGCQHLRSLAKELNGYNVEGKTFLLAMKGLEVPTAKIMHDIFKEEKRRLSKRWNRLRSKNCLSLYNQITDKGICIITTNPFTFYTLSLSCSSK